MIGHARTPLPHQNSKRGLAHTGVLMRHRRADLIDRKLLRLARQQDGDHGSGHLGIRVFQVLRQEPTFAFAHLGEDLGQCGTMLAVFEKLTDLRQGRAPIAESNLNTE